MILTHTYIMCIHNWWCKQQRLLCFRIASHRAYRERGELAVGAVVETRVAAHEGEGDSHDEGQAGGDEVAHGGDLGGLGSHAPGLCDNRVVLFSNWFRLDLDWSRKGAEKPRQGVYWLGELNCVAKSTCFYIYMWKQSMYNTWDNRISL